MSTTTRTPQSRARPLRTLSLVLAFTAAVGLIFGTAGFTAMEADRGFAVNVTDDEDAYLGYEPIATETDTGESTAVVEYRNRFGSDLTEFDVDVSIADPDSDVSLVTSDAPDHLDRGTTGRVTVTLRCTARRETDLLFEADGRGAGVTVSVDRTHTVTCVPTGPTVTGVEYHGVGSASVESRPSGATVEAIVWLADANPGEGGPSGDVRSVAVSNLNVSKPVQPQLPSDVRNERIAAIEFPEQGEAYFHPGWDGDQHADPSAGSGIRYDEVPLDAESVANVSLATDDAQGETDRP